MKRGSLFIKKVLPWLALVFILWCVFYYFTHVDEASCYSNSFIGDGGCTDVYE